MNNKYVIAIEKTLVQEFDISANNAEEAFRKAVEYYKNGTSVITQGEVQFKQMAIIAPYNEATDWKEFYHDKQLSYKEHQIPLLIMQLHNSTALYQKQTIRIMKDLPSGGRSFLFYLFFNLLIKFKISSTSSSLSSFKPQTAFCINSGFLNPSSKNSSGVIPK